MADRHETEHKSFGSPDGPDAWVVVDWYGASNYARGGRSARRK
jgi:hypothetical protein